MSNRSAHLYVDSEIGRLRKVLIHEPGLEWELVPAGLGNLQERYLVEDLFVLETARAEYEIFKNVLATFLGGGNVFEFSEQLTKSLRKKSVRREVVAAVAAIETLGFGAITRLHTDLTPSQLAAALIRGAIIRNSDDRQRFTNLFHPLPNLIFTRDIGAMLPGALVIARAANEIRQREILLLRHIVEYGDLFQATTKIDLGDQPFRIFWHGARRTPVSIEGGDIMVLDRNTLLIGVGQRTTEDAALTLMRRIFEHTEISTIVLVDIPAERASMHLDTIFTRISKSEFVCFKPAFTELKMTRWLKTSKGPEEAKEKKKGRLFLREWLEQKLKVELKWIECGGPSKLFAHREQWSDGANLLALAPGVVVAYRRNKETTKQLMNNGYEHVRGENRSRVQHLVSQLDAGKHPRAIITIPDSELSKARGGPRCMAMPLLRDSL